MERKTFLTQTKAPSRIHTVRFGYARKKGKGGA